ncbi:MAG TPA: nuclear transport factor 2 family protein [Pseudonocardia sp.]|nr:nuclear transport factor 2 family protein [Pseudonocardia sp.]
MQHHPLAERIGTAVAHRDPQRLAPALTETVRLRALLPGGPLQAHGRENVAARFHGFFAGFDTVQLVESAGEEVGDRLLIHYRLRVGQGPRRWVCTQTAVCKVLDGHLAVIDLLCSGFREVNDDGHVAATPGARLVG